MWVWRSLGCENAVELPQAALATLGRRCRNDHANRRGATESSGSFLGRNQLSTESSPWGARTAMASPEEFVKDARGDNLEICPPAPGQTEAVAAYRLSPHGDLRLCVPGSVVLSAGPPVSITDFHTPDAKPFSSVKEALKKLGRGGGGTFVFQVPMVDAQLREELAAECRATPAQSSWPLCVVGAMLGASLRIVMTVTDSGGQGSGRSVSLPSVVLGEADEARPVTIQCEGFELQIVQRGGPTVDPSKLHGADEKGVGEELERWAKKALATRPNTWRCLFVTAEPAAVEQSSLTGDQWRPVPARLPMLARGGRQMGDIVLAVSAEMEFYIEPFELSYGELHMDSLRQLVAGEVANVLGILTDQVLCGDFSNKSNLTRKRHVRRDTVTLRVALLHQGLVEIVRGRDMPTRKKVAPMAKGANLLNRSPEEQAMNGTLRPDGDKTSPLNGRRSVKATDLEQAAERKKGVCYARSMTTLREAEATFTTLSQTKSPKKKLSRANSAPILMKSMLMNDIGPMVTSNVSTGETLASGAARDMPPDQLMKLLVGCISDPKHPISKHTEIFPMLCRIIKGGVAVGVPLVASQDIIDSGKMGESIRALMKPKKTKKNTTELDVTSLETLSTMRTEILKIYAEPGGELAAEKSRLQSFSAKELLDAADKAFPQLIVLNATLEVMVEKTLDDQDMCMRIRLHHGIERLAYIMRLFSSDREIVLRCFKINCNLTKHDRISVDGMLEASVASDYITAADNFPRDEPLQHHIIQVLKRLYLRARETAPLGVRVVLLGKNLDEVWTFKGYTRLMTTMSIFKGNAEIQLECCITLASLGEFLQNNGMAKDVFRALEVVMRLHSTRADIMSEGVLIIARLGPAFLAFEHRGVKVIVDAMSRHRSSCPLQKVAIRSIYALSKQDDALGACKAGGSVSAIFAAMAGHKRDAQVLQEGTRALEKHCPRAVAAAARLCGDFESVLPMVTWSTGPTDASKGVGNFDLTGLEAGGGWDPSRIENLISDFSPTANERNDGEEENPMGNENSLAGPAGFRKRGLRDEIDAADDLWAAGSDFNVKLMNHSSPPHDVLQRDMDALQKKGCDMNLLRQAGPTPEQLKGFCDVMMQGVGPKKYSAQDGELLALLLGHFAWNSAAQSLEIIAFGGHKAIIAWLRTDRFKGNADPTHDTLAWPMQRACLSALSCLCRHGEDWAAGLLEMEVEDMLFKFAVHLDAGIRCAALRVLTRIIPHAVRRHPKQESLPSDSIMPLILKELHSEDVVLRTVATACALEAILDGWVSTNPSLTQELASALLVALAQASDTNNSAAALPALVAVARLASGEEESQDEAGLAAIMSHESLIPLLIAWLPKGAAHSASAAAKAAGASAAWTLRILSEGGAPLGGGELADILRYGTAVSAEPKLRETCQLALGFCVAREMEAGLLVQLLAGRLTLCGSGVEALADVEALTMIVQRSIDLIKKDPNQASEALIATLERVEPLVPLEAKGSRELQSVLEELISYARNGGTIKVASKLMASNGES